MSLQRIARNTDQKPCHLSSRNSSEAADREVRLQLSALTSICGI